MEENTENLEALILLNKQILTELQLLTSSIKTTALVRFQKEFLTTEQQREIFNAFNGERDSQDIAIYTGIALRSIQQLISDLQEKDFIDFVKRGKAIIPIKSFEKIAMYYAKLNIEDMGGSDNG